MWYVNASLDLIRVRVTSRQLQRYGMLFSVLIKLSRNMEGITLCHPQSKSGLTSNFSRANMYMNYTWATLAFPGQSPTYSSELCSVKHLQLYNAILRYESALSVHQLLPPSSKKIQKHSTSIAKYLSYHLLAFRQQTCRLDLQHAKFFR